MRWRLALGAVLAVLLCLGTLSTAFAGPPKTFTMKKVCPTVGSLISCDLVKTAETPSPFTLLHGGTITYDDHAIFETHGSVMESATITLAPSGGGETAIVGHVSWVRDRGYFTWSNGSGALAGMHAQGMVEYVGSTPDGELYRLTGTYHFAGAPD